MTKQTSLYEGHDSGGTMVQVAINSDRAFSRIWRYNGYGYGWSKWSPFTAEHPTEVYSQIDGEQTGPITVSDPTDRVMWGFCNLRRTTKNARIRLPGGAS